MKTPVIILFILLISSSLKSQVTDYNLIESVIVNLGEIQNENDDFKTFSNLDTILKGVEIVMLGEQSHGDATAYETKIKIIKYLHQNLDFDLLVFESGFYDCNKAWEQIQKGENVRVATGNSVFPIWSATKDLKPLVDYLEVAKTSENPLKICGFDSQFTGKYSKNYFLSDLTEYFRNNTSTILETDQWFHFSENITRLLTNEIKGLKRNEPKEDLRYIQNLITEISALERNDESQFWIQILKSTYAYLSDVTMKTDLRDQQMAENLIWIKKKYPNSKIICWGATSHFLYNSKTIKMKSLIVRALGGNYYKKQPMMGEYIKNEFQEKVYTIGFTAYQGEFGLFNRGKIKLPKEGTLEFLLSQSEYDNFLLPLNELNLIGFQSRPLGNLYMKNDITEVMDAVIFNRYMKRPRLDKNFFLKIYPENKYITPETEEK